MLPLENLEQRLVAVVKVHMCLRAGGDCPSGGIGIRIAAGRGGRRNHFAKRGVLMGYMDVMV